MTDISTQDFIEALTEHGGSEWSGYGHHRVYFDTAPLLGLEVERYGTGNVSGATLYGESISNSRARRLLDRYSGIRSITSRLNSHERRRNVVRGIITLMWCVHGMF